MKEIISIGINNNVTRSLKAFNNSVEKIKKSCLDMEMNYSEINETTFINLVYDDKLDNSDKVKKMIASVCAKIINEIWHRDYVWKVIREEYYYFSYNEKKSIYKMYFKLISEDSLYNTGLKLNSNILFDKLYYNLLDYLGNSQQLILEGFSTFRLKSYWEEIDDLIEKAVEEFVMEREYKEFIRLLKYFVDIQEPKLDTINILLCDNEVGFILVDDNNNNVSADCIKEIKTSSGENINYQDLLISYLITIAPNKIYIHNNGIKDKKETINTIKSIFFDRVTVCSGCKLCKGASIVKNSD